MKKPLLLELLRYAVLVSVFASAHLGADTVETKDGSKLIGKITKIEDGVIQLDTTYAGTLKIKQDNVAGFSTDAPLNVAFKGGNTLVGKVDNTQTGLQVSLA
ncbi:MAG TPA: hypothetical protein VKC60_14460, partial [Opitutaceae bacterium]|nr:hypothetical protein [Opitutaceae bacterium]